MRKLSARFALIVLIVLDSSAIAQESPHLDAVVQTGLTNATSIALGGDGQLMLTGYKGIGILRETSSGKILQTFQVSPVNGRSNVFTQDIASGRIREALPEPSDEIVSLALSCDGKRVLIGGLFNVSQWDVASGKKLWNFFHQGVQSVALSGDGRMSLCGGVNTILRETTNGKTLRTFDHSTSCVAMNFDGTLALMDSSDKSASLWHTTSGNKLRTFEHDEPVHSVALSGNGAYALTGSDSSAILWETASGKKLCCFDCNSKFGAALSSDGKIVLTGSGDSMNLWDAGGRRIRTFEKQCLFTKRIALSGDGKVALWAQEGVASLWDTTTGKEVSTIRSHLASVPQVCGNCLLTWSAEGTTVCWTRWDPTARKKPLTFRVTASITSEHISKTVQHLIPSEDGKHVLIQTMDYTGTLCETTNGKKLQTFAGDGGWVARTPTTPSRFNSIDDRFMVTGSLNNTAVLWDARNGKKRQTFKRHDDWVTSVALSRDARLAATGSHDKTALLWSTETGKNLHTLSHEDSVESLAFSGNGRLLLSGSRNSAILWDTTDGKKLQTFQEGHKHVVSSVALNGNGRLALTASYCETTPILWDTSTGERLRVFEGHTDTVVSVTLSEEGKQAWTASSDGTTRLWDPATGKERCRLYSFDEGKDWLVVTPDGLFDGSEGAWKFVTYHVPGTLKLLDDDATRRRFHRPGLLAQLVNGK